MGHHTGLNEGGNKPLFPYLHGFDEAEQARLHRQAELMEQLVYRDVGYGECTKILEVGCGVGAQTSILLRRYPRIHVTCIDANDAQLEACRRTLSSLPYAQGRFEVKKMDATHLEFEPGTFDGAFLCWVLEHIPKPARVIEQVFRVVRPRGRVYLTEVMNHAFFLDPYSPNVWKYWMVFNDYQFDTGGDPFVGAKLGHFLTKAGFQHVETNIKTTLLDNRMPHLRAQALAERQELLLSAADQLIKSNYMAKEMVDACKAELDSVMVNPDAVIMDSFMQAYATR